jgi:two-component system LytT family response regulator
MIRALLVDDEQPARERLGRLLAAFDDVTIVGEAEDGEQAVERIVALRPDVVFLDIQMPGCSGMEVAASLGSPRPKIVFCTAYDEYAVDAFELHAVDYLLKPVNRARLEKAIGRVRAERRGAEEPGLDGATGAAGYPSRFLARRGGKYFVVPRSEVLCFASDGGETKLLAADRHYWMDPSLTEMEARLDPGEFLRISRAAIVALDAIREVDPVAGGLGEITLKNGVQLEVSRRRFKPLLESLSRGRGT